MLVISKLPTLRHNRITFQVINLYSTFSIFPKTSKGIPNHSLKTLRCINKYICSNLNSASLHNRNPFWHSPPARVRVGLYILYM